jgi:GNAT superfamily N-acetyltransferase
LNTCHKDIIPFLKPDYIIDLDKNVIYLEIEDYNEILNDNQSKNIGEYMGEFFTPEDLEIEVFKLEKKHKKEIWGLFKKHHYLTSEINLSAHIYVAFWGNKIVGLYSCLAQPGKISNAWRGHRLVILPEFQGLGFGGRLSDFVADLYYKKGKRFFSKFSHPKLAEYRKKSNNWKETSNNKKTLKKKDNKIFNSLNYRFDKECYSYEYIGDGSIKQVEVKNENPVKENELFLFEDKIVFAKPVRIFTKEKGIVYSHIKRLYRKTQKHVKGYSLMEENEFYSFLMKKMGDLERGIYEFKYDDLYNEFLNEM